MHERNAEIRGFIIRGVMLAPALSFMALSSPSPRLCAPHLTSQHSNFIEEACDPSCSSDTCWRCDCRACPFCTCTDRLGVHLPPHACGLVRSSQINLSPMPTAEACRSACNQFGACGSALLAPSGRVFPFSDILSRVWAAVGGQYYASQPGSKSCTVWMHAHEGGACIGLEEEQMLEPGWEPAHGIQAGLATCGAPVPARVGEAEPASAQHKAFRHAVGAPMLVLHTAASYAVNPRVAARLARAHVELRQAGHFHRVVLSSEVCLHHEGCREPDDINAARTADNNAENAILFAIQHEAPAAQFELNGLAGIVVQRMTRLDVGRAFPRMMTTGKHVKWADNRRPKWLSNGCDLVALAWLALNNKALPTPHSHMWVIQHDVGWSGSLPATLRALDHKTDVSTAATTAHLSAERAKDRHLKYPTAVDLICTDASPKDDSWAHARARDAQHRRRYPFQRACLVPVVRYSNRLLDLLLEETPRHAAAFWPRDVLRSKGSDVLCCPAMVCHGGSTWLGPFGAVQLFQSGE